MKRRKRAHVVLIFRRVGGWATRDILNFLSSDASRLFGRLCRRLGTSFRVIGLVRLVMADGASGCRTQLTVSDGRPGNAADNGPLDAALGVNR